MNMAAKGSKRRLAFVLLLVVWLLKFIFGLTASIGQRAPNYPDAVRGFPVQYIGDVGFYVVVPAAFVLLNFFMLVFANKFPKWISIIVAILQLLLLLVLLLFSTGGI